MVELEEAFGKTLSEQYESVYQNSGPLSRLRSNAWEALHTLGLPGRKKGEYRYVPLRRLYTRKYVSKESELSPEKIESHILPECKGASLIFVNGRYRPDLSSCTALPKATVVLPMDQAMRSYGTFIQSRWLKECKQEKDSFALANAALHPQGLFFYLPPQVRIEQPVQILSFVDGKKESTLAFPRVHLFVGTGAQMDLITESIALGSEPVFINAALDVNIEKEGKLSCTHLYHHDEQVWSFHTVRASLKEESAFSSVALDLSLGGVTRQDYHVQLNGERSNARLDGLAMLKEKAQNHVHVLIEHSQPDCQSHQMFKNALKDFAKSSFQGKIYVHDIAQQTNAYQLNNNLLLSDGVVANSVPQLEIFADDVKASHGATFGELEEEREHYLRTRGLSKEQAQSLLVFGFAEEILQRLSLPSLREKYEKSVLKYMDE